uniref:Uncharacterized protein n=1 Tax=Ananas comosus var. bracteatus TaxID=296719 RepID=A0A6V7PQ24_ANACO|nr:unnamed protein product [Ananas comosus var. bracteatus]
MLGAHNMKPSDKNRRSLSRSVWDGTSGVPEKFKASGDLEFRELLATLVEVVRQRADVVQCQQEAAMRQEERIRGLQDIMDQLVITPVSARRVRPGVATEVFSSRSGNPTFSISVVEVERERALAALMTFKKLINPRRVKPLLVKITEAWREGWLDKVHTKRCWKG